jgi:hypothetical protein
MFRKVLPIIMVFFVTTAFASDYSNNQDPSYIHTTTLQSSWCGNLAVSTKVGKRDNSGKCIYQKETTAQGFDGCDPLHLNGGLLALNAGQGFNCAATHVHSNAMGSDGLDEYQLISDSNGHYVNTVANQGNIILK